MTREHEILELLDALYDAPLARDSWGRFADGLSAAFGDAAVAIAMQLPGPGSHPEYFGARLEPGDGRIFGRHFAKGLPWGAFVQPAFCERFGWGRDLLPDAAVPDTDFYREWMRRQGLAPEGPIAHVIAAEGARPLASIAIFRRERCRPFRRDDVAFADRLVPHLARAYRLHAELRRGRGDRQAFRHYLDRLAVGVVLLDADGRPVVVNEFARRLLASEDGLFVDERGPRAADPDESARLRELVSAAARRALGESAEAGELRLSLSRPSGRRPLSLLIGPLLSGPEGTGPGDPVVGLYASDPEAVPVPAEAALREVFHLTPAEADLVRYLANGHRLREAAELRGITLNTARTHLKQIFQKTHTERQSDLVRVVLAALGSVRDESEEG